MQTADLLELIKKGASVSIDSRNVSKGDVFFAINNGVNFVEDAFSKGAIAAVVPNNYICTKPRKDLFCVQDTLKFLLDVGEKIKLGSKANIIGITGSAGKTTTKVWLSQILSKHHDVTFGLKNYNTIYGLPICLTKLKPADEFGVFELGSNNFGEIRELSEYLKPRVGVITNIMDSHIGRFGNKQTLAAEKISIIDGISKKGTIVFNGDSEFFDQIVARAEERKIKTISYGFGQNNDFIIEDYIKYFGSLRGHFDIIKTCIIAIIHALELDINDYFKYMCDLNPLDGRGALKQFEHARKKFTIMDDSYNASPSTVLASLDFLSRVGGYKKKIAVLGEMKELGSFSVQYHAQILRYLKKIKVDNVFFIGSELISNAFLREGITVFREVNNQVIEKILEDVENDSFVLLKGSNSIGLNKFIEFLECF